MATAAGGMGVRTTGAGSPAAQETGRDRFMLALRLALEPPLQRAFRDRLEENRLRKPLFDAIRYRDHIEAAYGEMWQIWQRGEKPRSFAVAARGD